MLGENKIERKGAEGTIQQSQFLYYAQLGLTTFLSCYLVAIVRHTLRLMANFLSCTVCIKS